MALNRKYPQANLTLPLLPVGSGVVSGDPIVFGTLPAVALIDRRADGKATSQKDGILVMSVAAIDDSGVSAADANSAVAIGDKIYYDSGDTPMLSKRTDGIFWGIALSTLTTGTTGDVDVQCGW